LLQTSGKYRYGGGAQYVITIGIIMIWNKLSNALPFCLHKCELPILNQQKIQLFAVYSNLYSGFDNRTGRVQAANINVNSNFSTKKMIISIMVLALHQL
jgi:hypothetical protein